MYFRNVKSLDELLKKNAKGGGELKFKFKGTPREFASAVKEVAEGLEEAGEKKEEAIVSHGEDDLSKENKKAY